MTVCDKCGAASTFTRKYTIEGETVIYQFFACVHRTDDGQAYFWAVFASQITPSAKHLVSFVDVMNTWSAVAFWGFILWAVARRWPR
jgi:hypothetical protein